MAKDILLFIDESGHHNPTNRMSDIYILSGCVIAEDRRQEVKIFSDQIKYKYWSKTDIVFHSRDIARNEGDFSIFAKKPELKDEFIKELLTFLQKVPVNILTIVTDKKLARKKGWNEVKVVRETAHQLIYHFIATLLCKPSYRGKIIIESASAEKDRHYLNAFAYFLSPGFTELGVDYTTIQKMLTSISFVTKKNHDIEEQIADLLAYAAKCKFEQENKIKSFSKDSYEAKIITILENKLFPMPSTAGARKLKLYEKIEPFCIIPKT